MIIDCIADLHGFKPELPGGDLLIVVGDLTARDQGSEYIDFFEWLVCDTNYRKKIFIGGNHDNALQEHGFTVPPKYSEVEYLCDSGTEFEGLKIWGSPWTKKFPGMNPHCKAFTCHTEEKLDVYFSKIPNDTDILITHSPPYAILDEIETGNVGSLRLLDALDRVIPRLHCFGHIHENGGKQLIYKRPGYGDENNTICVNASIVDENYRHVNKPVRIEL